MDGNGGTAAGQQADAYLGVAIDTVKAILESLTSCQKDLIELSFEKVITSDTLKGHVREAVPYMYAASVISLSGREITEENVSRVLRAAGIEPDRKIIDQLLAVGLRNHLPYVYAYYLLLALGRHGSNDEVARIVRSLGIEPDESRITEVVSFISAHEDFDEEP